MFGQISGNFGQLWATLGNFRMIWANFLFCNLTKKIENLGKILAKSSGHAEFDEGLSRQEEPAYIEYFQSYIFFNWLELPSESF